eukprot:CAMPEP_0201145368 /NCGR_PEP_ID=MMETSP0851-20130426/7098_1 /ASSEMBLY_ACC=CAM_ASM_000631 /TAXON_ID=183588 /ORGANISM="Pseudo-nitzschia fraudulenta, Strain WWA7" /LENGTH=75 /DNA_ID=CAMNT_0047420495 /DNA_START=78 /DNA_END=302 /DNA_ORIENTATION=-
MEQNAPQSAATAMATATATAGVEGLTPAMATVGVEGSTWAAIAFAPRINRLIDLFRHSSPPSQGIPKSDSLNKTA